MHLIKLPHKLPRKQAKMVNRGLRKIAPWNPVGLDGDRESWLVMDGENPIGYLSVRKIPDAPEHMGQVGELAVNFWEGGLVSAPKLVPNWIEDELSAYQYYTARVWSRNKRIKRLLARAGFALLQKEGRQELYGVTRAHFLGLKHPDAAIEYDEESVADTQDDEVEAVSA